jgi:hypothetical protein
MIAYAHDNQSEIEKKNSLMDDRIIQEAEIMAKVLIAAHKGAEEDMVRYVKHSTDADGQDPSALAKVFEDAGAPVLARIAEKAADAPPCPAEPLSHKVIKFGVSTRMH